MSLLIRNSLNMAVQFNCATRSFSCGVVLNTKQWRISKGLSINRNAEGVLTDGPDYTFLDGRPTPLLHKQKIRLMKQQGIASKIVALNAELDFAIEREKKLHSESEQKRQTILSNRLKPKGYAMLKKTK